MVRFGIGLRGELPVLQTAELARTAEESGFEYVWISDENPSPSYRDVFVTMTAIALRTERIKIGTGICNPYSRHPAQLAVAISSLNEMARGRVILGLGPGGSLPLRPLGIKLWNKPISAIREAFKILRGLFAGETVNLEGTVLTAVNCKLDPPPKERIPVYLAARGPKMLELVGELSDGAILTAPLGYLDFALDRIKAGAEKAGRQLEDINIANWIPFAMIENSEKALGVGIPEATKKLTPAMVDALAISGTPEECEKKIGEFINAGVTQVILVPPFGGSPKDVIERVGKITIPKFR